MIGKGFQENTEIDEGADHNGIRTIVRFEGDELIIQKQQDMEPILAHVQQMRERNHGRGWGSGVEVGHIPQLFLDRINAIVDRDDRNKAIKAFFRANPAFCAYPAYLK